MTTHKLIHHFLENVGLCTSFEAIQILALIGLTEIEKLKNLAKNVLCHIDSIKNILGNFHPNQIKRSQSQQSKLTCSSAAQKTDAQFPASF